MGDKHYHYHYHFEGTELEGALPVELTQKNTDEINRTKEVNLVPGDIVTEITPYVTSQVDCSTYASANLIMHVKNTGAQPNSFFARGTFGPIGSLSEVETIGYNRPMAPGEEFVWFTTRPVFAQYFKAYFSIVGNGEVDVNASIVLSKATVAA